jgi:hypothetical protein
MHSALGRLIMPFRWILIFPCSQLTSQFIGKQIPINPMGEDRLIPTISIYNACVHANFGNDLVYKPFYYNIYKCPGLIFEWICPEAVSKLDYDKYYSLFYLIWFG